MSKVHTYRVVNIKWFCMHGYMRVCWSPVWQCLKYHVITQSWWHVAWAKHTRLQRRSVGVRSRRVDNVRLMWQGWKLAPAHQPMASTFYIGPVGILSGLVKCPPIPSLQIMGFGSCRAGPVDKKVGFDACVGMITVTHRHSGIWQIMSQLCYNVIYKIYILTKLGTLAHYFTNCPYSKCIMRK